MNPVFLLERKIRKDITEVAGAIAAPRVRNLLSQMYVYTYDIMIRKDYIHSCKLEAEWCRLLKSDLTKGVLEQAPVFVVYMYWSSFAFSLSAMMCACSLHPINLPP